MFNKIKCDKCNQKVSKKDSFCPNCGNYLSPYKKPKEKKGDYGMLGNQDEFTNEFNNMTNSMFGGFGGKIFNKMLNQTMKMLEKEIQKNMQEVSKQNSDESLPQNKTHFELFINGKRINPNQIKVTQKPVQFTEKNLPKKPENSNKFFATENIKKFSELPKKEPKTELRRLQDKIIYEISVPGVQSLEDISIVKLENSIEIKAVSKDKAYSKIIPVNLDISGYGLSKGKIILELIE